jgi:hypothetical protein
VSKYYDKSLKLPIFLLILQDNCRANVSIDVIMKNPVQTIFHCCAGLGLFFASLIGTAAPLEFRVDTTSQVNGGDVFKQVENFWHHKGAWKGAPEDFVPDPDWLRERTEGVIRFMSGDYGLAQARQIFRKDASGRIVFSPPPGFVEMLDTWSGQPDVGIWLNMGTNAIPAPLIEGGYKTDVYGYNVRQPNDYDAYYDWLISFFEFVVDRYGREEVSRWVFQFGFEADWQTKFLVPGTQELMSKADNRKEFIKLLDYFYAAATEVVGPEAAVACYFALITQANDYIRHWAAGTNHKTGETGTRIAFVGFSDWYHIGPKPAGDWYDPETFKMSPFTADQSGDGNAHGNAYVGGMKFKYDYLLNLLARYPEIDDIQFYVPESGYIQVGSAHPAPLTFADEHGAALYALRTMAFAHFPKIVQVGNNFSLSTGDRGAWFHDAAKPPVFHIQRIQQKLAGERRLEVTPGLQVDQPTEIRAVASASDPAAKSQRIRFLATNFNFRFHKLEGIRPDYARTLRVVFEGLPPEAETVTVTTYRIDAENNNWWNDYVAWREREGLEFATSGYGVWAKYDIKYAAHVNDPMGTLRPEDRETWLAKSAGIAGTRDRFQPTGKPVELPVLNGEAVYSFDLGESEVMYLEAEYETAPPLADYNLDFTNDWERWRRIGRVEWRGGADEARVVALREAAGGSELRQLISGLPANTPVTFSADIRGSGRNVSGRLFAEQPLGRQRAESELPRTAQWSRLAVTTRTDDRGRIVIGARLPEQGLTESSHLDLRDLRLRVLGE